MRYPRRSINLAWQSGQRVFSHEKLDAQKAQENVCKILRRNGKYLWASRENEELVLVESGLF